jgi:MFS transporter
MRLLPPAGAVRRLGVVTLVDSVGTGMFLTVSVLFLTRMRGFTAAEVAGTLSAAGLAALVGAIPLGSFGDRFGHRRMWTVWTLVLAGSHAVLPMVHGTAPLLVVLTAAALAEVGISPVRGAYISQLAGPRERVRVRAYTQAVANVGFAVGAAVGAVGLHLDSAAGYVVLLLGNAASYLVAAAVLATLPALAVPRRVVRMREVLADRAYLAVAALNGVLTIYLAVLTVALPLWISLRTAAPTWTVGALVVLNTGLVVAGQVRASRGADTVPGAAAAIRRSGVALLGACLVFALSAPLPAAAALAVLVAGLAALTVGELLHSAGSWGISFGLAPAEAQGQYLGAFAMGGRIYDAAGPALVTACVLGWGAAGWVMLGVLFLGAALALAATSRWALHRRGPVTS